MNIYLNILIVVCFIALSLCIRMLIRNQRVCDFRNKVNRLCHKYSTKHSVCDWSIYNSMASYDSMLWSTKPLELKYWLSKNDIYKLLN